MTTLLALILLLTPAPAYRMTYADVLRFMARDQTEQLLWGDDFGCIQFTETLARNAQRQGFAATGVQIYLSLDDLGNVEGHNFVQFYTTDRGVVWFEPQTDEEYWVRQVGQKFCTTKGYCWIGSIMTVKPVFIQP